VSHLHRIVPIAVLLVATLTPAAARTPPPQTPTTEELLKAAGTYLDAYATKISGTTLDELFILIELSGPNMQVPQRLYSDLVLLKIDVAGHLLGVRDPYAVDKKKLRAHDPRVTDALEHPTLASWAAVQGYGRENAIYLRANGVIWFSDPMTALDFISKPNQPRMTYKVEGSKKINGVQVYGVGFKESERPDTTYLLGTPDHARGSGRVWIDPATGAIHDTELWVDSETETARVHVAYTMEPTRSVLLPHEADGTFDERERGSKSIASGVNTKVGFEAHLTYSNPRYTPIDLTHIIAR